MPNTQVGPLPSKEGMIQYFQGFLFETQGHNLALTVFTCIELREHTPWDFHLTQCINQMVLKSQPAHKIVNSLI